MKRILIVNVNWLGDALFSTPAIRALKKKYPQSFIAVLVPERVKGVFQKNPHLDEVMCFPEKISFLNKWKYLNLYFAFKKKNFDTAIFFRHSTSKALVAKLAGISRRIGYARDGRKAFLTETVLYPTHRLHRADTFLNLAQSVGAAPDGRYVDFYPSLAQDADEAALLLRLGISKDRPYVVLHAGGNWDLKRWPADYFVQWIRLFKTQYDWKIVLCGTKSEEILHEKIASSFPEEAILSLCGKTTLDELAVVLKHASFLISNDSGPIHLAASQQTKILGLFGPTSEFETGPLSKAPVTILRKDVGCEVPCYYKACNYRICMEWLKPDEVLEAVKKLVNS